MQPRHWLGAMGKYHHDAKETLERMWLDRPFLGDGAMNFE